MHGKDWVFVDCRRRAHFGVSGRIGMHLLFCGKEQVKLLEGGKLESHLREQSQKVRVCLLDIVPS